MSRGEQPLATTAITVAELVLIGPTIGTAVYFALGPLAALGLNALTFFLSALGTLFIRVPGAGSTGQTGVRPSLWSQVRAGLRYARTSPFVCTTWSSMPASGR